MGDSNKTPGTLYDLVRALSRWENEGGAEERDEGSGSVDRVDEERVMMCLGAAVILQWNHLPNQIQRTLFEHATSLSDDEHRFQLKQKIAGFLHRHKDGKE